MSLNDFLLRDNMLLGIIHTSGRQETRNQSKVSSSSLLSSYWKLWSGQQQAPVLCLLIKSAWR